MTEKEKLIERLRGYTTPELCDGAGTFHTMDYHIKPRAAQRKIVGTAFTVDLLKGVSGIVPDAILQVKPGDIIVIAGKGECNRSYWGDHRSICARMQGAEGVIVDGAFRDVDGCHEAGLPIYARGITPGSATKEKEGAINVPVICGGVEVCPGDFIVGDCNGIIVFKPEEAEGIMERADKKIRAQENTIREMRETGIVMPRVIMK